MQSGKFFSDDVLKELGVLKEDSQVDEAPLGALAGLGARLRTVMPGQSTRARARGELESGKEANALYREYYNELGRNNQRASAESIIKFLQKYGIPTNNAETVLNQSVAKPTQKTPSQPPTPPNSPAAKSTQKTPSQPPTLPYPRTGTPVSSLPPPPSVRDQELDNIKRDQEREKYQAQVAAARAQDDAANKATDDVRKALGSTMEESINDILRLSGLKEIVLEQLTNKQISDAFFAAAGEYLDQGGQPGMWKSAADTTAQAQAPAAQPATTPTSGINQSGAGNAAPSASTSDTARSKSASSTTGLDPKEIFNNWLTQNKNDKDLLNFAKSEIEKTLTDQTANPATVAQNDAPDKSKASLVRMG